MWTERGTERGTEQTETARDGKQRGRERKRKRKIDIELGSDLDGQKRTDRKSWKTYSCGSIFGTCSYSFGGVVGDMLI